MKITRKSPVTGQLNTKDIDINTDQYEMWLAGELIQLAAPELSPEDREFMISGTLPHEWELMFPNVDYE